MIFVNLKNVKKNRPLYIGFQSNLDVKASDIFGAIVVTMVDYNGLTHTFDFQSQVAPSDICFGFMCNILKANVWLKISVDDNARRRAHTPQSSQTKHLEYVVYFNTLPIKIYN